MQIKENFLHFIWQHRFLAKSELRTTAGRLVIIEDPGRSNLNSGPDFFNTRLIIDGQKWAGNTELHLRASDWYVHHHEVDPAYDNVILHVVWEYDTDIFRANNETIPTLELKGVIDKALLYNYINLFKKKTGFILCDSMLKTVPAFKLNNWLERLFVERLKMRADLIESQLKQVNGNWEALLFRLLAKNFGLKVNGAAFFNMAQSFDFKIIQKIRPKRKDLEALFFGQAGFLNEDPVDEYHRELTENYNFLRSKYKLEPQSGTQFKFFRLRPSNFPTVRLAQLAALYHKSSSLFTAVLEAKTQLDLYNVFRFELPDYWKTHYRFGSPAKRMNRNLSKSFTDLLLINTVFPLLFYYNKSRGGYETENIFKMMETIKPEMNRITEKFSGIGLPAHSAMQSQALLQLKRFYCDQKRCLHCGIGLELLKRK